MVVVVPTFVVAVAVPGTTPACRLWVDVTPRPAAADDGSLVLKVAASRAATNAANATAAPILAGVDRARSGPSPSRKGLDVRLAYLPRDRLVTRQLPRRPATDRWILRYRLIGLSPWHLRSRRATTSGGPNCRRSSTRSCGAR